MYFLRRRHGRKPGSDQRADQRRDKLPAVVQQQQQPPAMPPAMPTYAEPEEHTPPQPVIKTKPRRARVELPEDDFKPAGTFRAGTLHIARGSEGAARHE